MIRCVFIILLFVFCVLNINPNEVRIKDLSLKDSVNKTRKLFIIDELGKNYGYYLIISKTTQNSIKPENLLIMDMTEAPFYEKIDTSMVSIYIAAYNKMIMQTKMFKTMLGVSIPVFFVCGGAGFGLLYLTYYLFTSVSDPISLVFQAVGGVFTWLFGAVFSVVCVIALVFFFVSTISLAVTTKRNKKRYNDLKENVLNNLNNSYQELNNKISFDIKINL